AWRCSPCAERVCAEKKPEADCASHCRRRQRAPSFLPNAHLLSFPTRTFFPSQRAPSFLPNAHLLSFPTRTFFPSQRAPSSLPNAHLLSFPTRTFFPSQRAPSFLARMRAKKE